jgi:hypothetical protein
MSSSTSNSSHARTRSLRIPPSNSLKPPQPAPGPSNITLFLTNLRLLDLDLRDDWPDITALTFSTKDAQQNQKKRIQCVEWALYQLFALWDPEETRNVLLLYMPINSLQILTWSLIETTAILPSTRTSAIPQPSRCPLPMSRPSQEGWSLGQGYGIEEDNAG